MIHKYIKQLGNRLKKIQKLSDDFGLKQTFEVILNRYLMGSLIGNKTLHSPYYVTKLDKFLDPLKTDKNLLPIFKRYPVPTTFPRTYQLSDAKLLLLCNSFLELPSQLINALKNKSKFLEIKSINNINNLKTLLEYDGILIIDLPLNYKLRTYLRYAHAHYIPSFYWHYDLNIEDKITSSYLATDFLLIGNIPILQDHNIILSTFLASKELKFSNDQDNQNALNKVFTLAMQSYQKRHLPSVSLIVNLSSFIDGLENCLQSYVNQDYAGEWEIIFFNYSLDFDSASIIEKFLIQFQKTSIFANESLLEISEKAIGELFIFIDSNSVINQSFIENHVYTHSFTDCEVSLGKRWKKLDNIDFQEITIKKINEDCINLYVQKVDQEDIINLTSFLNFNLSNCGIKREILNSILTTNINDRLETKWRNVEIGYKLYQQNTRFKFVPDAITIDIEKYKMKNEYLVQSFKSLRYLIEKNSELNLIARKWILDTHEKLSTHANKNNLTYLGNQLSKYSSDNFSKVYKSHKKLKILTYPWHVSHQHELYKLPYEFTLITDLGTWASIGWDLKQRPIPNNVNFKSIRDIYINDFDIAILHFDENILNPNNTKGAVGKDWGRTFKYFCEQIDLPKVAICHGTPQFYGQYDIDYSQSNFLQIIEEERQKIVDYLGDILTITNSYQANQEWQFKKSKVIWQGFDPIEFPQTTYRKGILTPFGSNITSRPHYRGYFIYQEVFKDFPIEFYPHTLNVKEPNLLYFGNQYAGTRFRNYVDEIRQYSVYFNPTIRSPMPRSRGEAMMCGLTTVSLKNHDVDQFITNGVNGFYSEDTDELKDFLLYLMKNPDENRKIGQKGRDTAMDIFNNDRYLHAWTETLKQLI